MNMLARTARSSKMRALLCAALPTLLFSAILPALTPSVYAQASTPESHAETPIIARAARGSVGSIEITYRDGPLQAKPLRDANAPVLVRVTTLGADRFRVDYIGSITGTFDLRPAIERADGRTPEGLGSLSVEIFSQLPAEAGTDVFGLYAADRAIEQSGLTPWRATLDADAIAVRVGHHCCMPLMSAFGIPGTVRASFGFYNTEDEVLRLEASLRRIRKMTA
jgi:hypothetical protein